MNANNPLKHTIILNDFVKFTVCKNDIMMRKKLPAFTLTELLVVLVIIGVLVLLALPNLMPLISRAKATGAKLGLTTLHTMERTHFYTYSKYSDNLEEIDITQEKLVTEGGGANYLIEIIEATTTTFKARATAVVDFDGDGVFNVWEINQDKVLIETVKD